MIIRQIPNFCVKPNDSIYNLHDYSDADAQQKTLEIFNQAL